MSHPQQAPGWTVMRRRARFAYPVIYRNVEPA